MKPEDIENAQHVSRYNALKERIAQMQKELKAIEDVAKARNFELIELPKKREE
jgi:hypothetical protein